MNNHTLTDEKYKVATSRKQKHLVSVLNALECTAQLLLGAQGYVPFSAAALHGRVQSPSLVTGDILSVPSW